MRAYHQRRRCGGGAASSSAAEIDDVLSGLTLDFRPLPTTWQVLDAGNLDGAPPTDFDGLIRPLDGAVDIGAYEVLADTRCSDAGLAAGEACDDGLASTADDTCADNGACQGMPYSCVLQPCDLSATHNGVDCDKTFIAAGVPCDVRFRVRVPRTRPPSQLSPPA